MDDETIYDDNDVTGPPQVFHRAPDLYEPLDDKNVTDALWFAGTIDRAEAESRITGPGVPGNFLIRQKDRSRKVFAHSYLSRTKGKCVHNLIELKASGEWLVDGQPFSARTLDELVEKLQNRLRHWRKLEAPTAAVKRLVTENYHIMYMPNIDRAQANSILMNKPTGSFVIRNSSTPNCYALAVKKPGSGAESVYNGIIVHSNQGVYLKFSELIGNTLEELIQVMLSNPERLVAGGVPVALRAPDPNDNFDLAAEGVDEIYEDADDTGGRRPSMSARPLPSRPPADLPSANTEFANHDDYNEEPIYDSGDDIEPGLNPGFEDNSTIYDDAEHPEHAQFGGPQETIYDDEESALAAQNDTPPPLPGRSSSVSRHQAYGMPSDLDDAPPPLPGRASSTAISAQAEDLYDGDGSDYDDDFAPPIPRKPPMPLPDDDGGLPPLPPRPH